MNGLAEERAPVIVGVGQIMQRTKDPNKALEPLALMDAALRAAQADANCALLERIDSLNVVAEYSWPYADAPGALSRRIGASRARLQYGEVGGETPVHFIHEAALRISRGESKVCAVVGAEANYAVAALEKTGHALPWSPRDSNAKLIRGVDYLHPLAVRLGVATPATVYPFYEMAAQAAWGQTPDQGLMESGRMWADCSEVAASNPYAWQRVPLRAEEITTPTEKNRLVAWPYTVSMVANPMVNQGAAVVLMALGEARRLGIAEERMVHVWCGAAASEPVDYLLRDQYQHSNAQDAVLEAIMEQVGGTGPFRQLELYSCFPIVPKMARRTLALSADVSITCTGGHSFFGAPLNNYMTHAAAAMVQNIRDNPGGLALLYGQGGYLTEHHAIALSSRRSHAGMLSPDYSVQYRADARAKAPPPLALDYEGPALVETFTVLFNRDGTVKHGVVIGRTPDDARILARVDPGEADSIAFLTRRSASSVGAIGGVYKGAEGIPHWRVRH